MSEDEKKHKWYAIDLDGVLAVYNGNIDHPKALTFIGDPVPKMVDRIKTMLAEGKDVRIFTARIGERTLFFNPHVTAGEVIDAIQKWCKKHIGQKLIVTCIKDYGMIELWDDRCIQVIPNTGGRINEKSPRANFSICSVCKKKKPKGLTTEECIQQLRLYSKSNKKLGHPERAAALKVAADFLEKHHEDCVK